MRKKHIPLLSIITLLVSCNQTNNIKVVTHTAPGYFVGDEFVFPMNTLVNLKMYDENTLDEVSSEFDNIVTSLSKEVDRYHNYENIINLKTINDSCGLNQELQLTDSLYEMIELGINLTKITKGKFNLAMGSIIDLYSSKLSEETSGVFNTLPEQSLISEALLSIPTYEDIDSVIQLNKEKKSITLNKYNDKDVIISLGGIAKGFVMQKAYDYLKKYNYSCLFDAGSSTMGVIGNNPLNDKGTYNISFRNPLIDNSNYNSTICTVSIKGDAFLSTSGDYTQNFFYYDENENVKLMHHIIDPYTGVSNNYVREVSLISNNTSLAVLDALSTAIFNIENTEDVLSLIDDIEDYFNCDISFMLVKPYNNTYDRYNVEISTSFNKLLISNLIDSVINKKVIENY